MKKRLATAALCAALFAASFCTAGLISGAVSGAQAAEPLREAEPSGYTLREEDGAIVVYNNLNLAIPAIITDIDAALLRAADRALLTEGIRVETMDEALRLLEDLGS